MDGRCETVTVVLKVFYLKKVVCILFLFLHVFLAIYLVSQIDFLSIKFAAFALSLSQSMCVWVWLLSLKGIRRGKRFQQVPNRCISFHYSLENVVGPFHGINSRDRGDVGGGSSSRCHRPLLAKTLYNFRFQNRVAPKPVRCHTVFFQANIIKCFVLSPIQ